jgi:protoporphyrinogen oxidase
VRALLRDLPAGAVSCGEEVVAIDTAARVVRTSHREIAYGSVVSSAPLPALARVCGAATDAAAFTSNKVLVFNLGFDAKGARGVHWMYFPDRARVFYRVGWYDNIFEAERMSLYVEIGATADAAFDVDALRDRVMADLREEGVVTTQRLVAHHHVVLDPAYCHITKASIAETARLRAALSERGVWSIGRYGAWTYCSIEDNIVEARALADRL